MLSPQAKSLSHGKQIGQKSLTSLGADVPSVIVPDENNVLINARHADATTLTITKISKWTHDGRLGKR